MPQKSKNCDFDAFISSTPYEGKVFLHPWKRSERTGDWFEARGYCAKHCAELVTIQSEKENDHFLKFMRSVNAHDAVWLGAQIVNGTDFTVWSDGKLARYSNLAPGERNKRGRTCANAAFRATDNFWYNYYCTHASYLVACQRSESWKIFECDT